VARLLSKGLDDMSPDLCFQPASWVGGVQLIAQILPQTRATRQCWHQQHVIGPYWVGILPAS
jgi:hypothetical protein